MKKITTFALLCFMFVISNFSVASTKVAVSVSHFAGSPADLSWSLEDAVVKKVREFCVQDKRPVLSNLKFTFGQDDEVYINFEKKAGGRLSNSAILMGYYPRGIAEADLECK